MPPHPPQGPEASCIHPTSSQAAGLTEIMKDQVVWALTPGGGLSSLWNLALLRLTGALLKCTSYWGLWLKAGPPPFITSPNSTPRDLNSHPSSLPGVFPVPGTGFLTVCVSRNTVLKRQRGLTAPACFPAAWRPRVPRRVRTREWPRSPLPGRTPCLSECPVVCARPAAETARCRARLRGRQRRTATPAV